MTDTTRAFYAGKDSVPGDKNPYEPLTAEWRAWRHGFDTEWSERKPMSAAEVKAAFAALNKRED